MRIVTHLSLLKRLLQKNTKVWCIHPYTHEHQLSHTPIYVHMYMLYWLACQYLSWACTFYIANSVFPGICHHYAKLEATVAIHIYIYTYEHYMHTCNITFISKEQQLLLTALSRQCCDSTNSAFKYPLELL